MREEKTGWGCYRTKSCCCVLRYCGGVWNMVHSSQRYYRSSHCRLSGDKDLHLVCGAGGRGPAQRKCWQEQSHAGWGLQPAGQKCIPDNGRGGKTTNMRNFHKRPGGGRQGATKRALHRSGRARAGVWGREQDTEDFVQSLFYISESLPSQKR